MPDYSLLYRKPIAFVLVAIVILTGSKLHAQPPLFPNYDYIEAHSEEAVEQMLTYRIPASVILAQAIFESRCGTSQLARRSNNHFGIKCHVEWGGDTIRQDDDTSSECFRSYAQVKDSYTDHSKFLLSRARYASLFNLPLYDYKAWCAGLKNAGYATYPDYADVLITLIENYRLYELDRVIELHPKPVQIQRPCELMSSTLSTTTTDLKTFAASEALFSDEFDIHLKSLLLLVKRGKSAL